MTRNKLSIDGVRKKANSESMRRRNPPKNEFLEAARVELAKEREKWRKSHSIPITEHGAKTKRVRAIFWDALRRGLVEKKEYCEIRLNTCTVYAEEYHHESYEEGEELKGRWACKKCHEVLTRIEKLGPSKKLAAQNVKNKPLPK